MYSIQYICIQYECKVQVVCVLKVRLYVRIPECTLVRTTHTIICDASFACTYNLQMRAPICAHILYMHACMCVHAHTSSHVRTPAFVLVHY